jgi:hypothetical protein
MRFILVFFILFSSNVFSKEIVKIGVTHYPPFVDKEKKDLGIFPRYIKAIFKKTNYDVKFIFLPYSRNILSVRHKRMIDFTIIGAGNISELESQISVVKTKPFYQTKICIFYNKDKFKNGINAKELSKLKKYTIVSIIKSPINAELDNLNIKYLKVSRFDSALKMLFHKRADVFPNTKEIGEIHLKDKYFKGHNIVCENNISVQDIHLISSKVKKYQKLIKLLNKNIIMNKIQ